MKSFLMTLVLLLVPTTLLAQGGDHEFETFLKSLLTNKAVSQHMDKEDQPVAPYFAEKYLSGDGWAAWAVEHNWAEVQRARDTAIPRTEVRVNIGSPFYPQLGYRRYRGAPVYRSYSTYYGGGSVGIMMYNPYAPLK